MAKWWLATQWHKPLAPPVILSLTPGWETRIKVLCATEIIGGCVFSMQIVLEADAEAESIRLKGEAEAFAIEAKAKAEAEQMAKKAEAWKDYQEAAMVDMVLSTLPKVC